MAKPSPEQRKYHRKQARDNYHKHKDEINRRRRKTKNKKQSTRKKRPTRKKRSTSFKPRNRKSLSNITQSGHLKIHCHIHKKVVLVRLVYNTAIRITRTKRNKKGLTGFRGLTNWFYCPECDVPRKATLTVE